MPGPRPEPAALRRLHGNPSVRPVPKEPMPRGEDVGDAPQSLSERERESWYFHIAHAPLGVLKQIDRAALVNFVVAEERHLKALEFIHEYGDVINLVTRQFPEGHWRPNPMIAVLSDQSRVMLRAAEQLGFTPASRPRLAVPRASEEIYGAKTAEEQRTEPRSLDAWLSANPKKAAVN